MRKTIAVGGGGGIRGKNYETAHGMEPALPNLPDRTLSSSIFMTGRVEISFSVKNSFEK